MSSSLLLQQYPACLVRLPLAPRTLAMHFVRNVERRNSTLCKSCTQTLNSLDFFLCPPRPGLRGARTWLTSNINMNVGALSAVGLTPGSYELIGFDKGIQKSQGRVYRYSSVVQLYSNHREMTSIFETAAHKHASGWHQ